MSEGIKLLKARRAKKVTILALARGAGIQKKVIKAVENGEKRLTAVQRRKVAKYLKVSETDLMTAKVRKRKTVVLKDLKEQTRMAKSVKSKAEDLIEEFSRERISRAKTQVSDPERKDGPRVVFNIEAMNKEGTLNIQAKMYDYDKMSDFIKNLIDNNNISCYRVTIT